MAKTSMKIKQQREAKFSTRAYTRCRLCGRPHSVLRKYGICPHLLPANWLTRASFPACAKASW